MQKAVYAGSFDPITNGHLWMIEKGSKLFDELIIAVGVRPDKKSTFSLTERVDMIKKSTLNLPNVTADYFEKDYLVDYSTSLGTNYILRGIRNVDDYLDEIGIKRINEDLCPGIITTFLAPPVDIANISSSMVKDLIGFIGWEGVVKRYVPRPVYNKLLERYKGNLESWTGLWKRIGAIIDSEIVYREIVETYADLSRHYHDNVHISDCILELKEVKHLLDDPDASEMAIRLHDILYNTKSMDNKKNSASFSSHLLIHYMVPEPFVTKVYNHILATRHDEVPEDNDAKYIVDIDLAILGKSKKEFDEAGMYIREEYRWVNEKRFTEERKKFFEKILKRDNIYCTEFFRKKYEKKAKKNIEICIEELEEKIKYLKE